MTSKTLKDTNALRVSYRMPRPDDSTGLCPLVRPGYNSAPPGETS